MIRKFSVDQFIECLASSSPTPGGGSAGAIGGAIGGALLSMALNISFKADSKPEEIARLIQKLRLDSDALKELAEQDSKAYDVVMAGFKMPKESPEQKEARKAAIQNALKIAADVPFKTASHCSSVLAAAVEVFKVCKSSCFSDAYSGFYFALAGFRSGMANILINLSSIKDPDYKSELENKLSSLKADFEKSYVEGIKILKEKSEYIEFLV